MKTSINVFFGATVLALVLSTKAVAIPIWDTGPSSNGALHSNRAEVSDGTGAAGFDASWSAGGQQGGASAAGAGSGGGGFGSFNSSSAGRGLGPVRLSTDHGQTRANSVVSRVADFVASLNNNGDNGNRGDAANPRSGESNPGVGQGNLSSVVIGQPVNLESVVDLTAHTVPDTGLSILLVAAGFGVLALARLPRRSA